MRVARWLLLPCLAVLLAGACAVLPIHAAEESESNPAEAPVGTMFRWLNILLVAGGGAYALRKKAPAFFRGRAANIAETISASEASRAEAEQKLREAEDVLARIGEETAELRAAAGRDFAAEAERIRKFTADEIEKIGRVASAEREAAERAAKLELRALAAELAVARAGEQLRRRVDARSQASLFGAFLENLERKTN